MTYLIIYDAVRKKAATTPPNNLIGNVEMAAGIGMVMHEAGMEFDITDITEPELIKQRFQEYLKKMEPDSLSAESKIIIELIEHYQVKRMVNEKMRNLLDLCGMKQADEED
ncbi:MAG: DUF3837 domain-containing protein [Lachnospiraceae bacterium]|nr:DUF3837 domain-containing protein [Lachnospiraceae bacterium]